MHDADVIIVGAGPAGITAAMQLRRYGLRILMFEQDMVGGLLWHANLVENYPGFYGIGAELAGRMAAQLERYEVPVLQERVERVEYSQGMFDLSTADTQISCPFLLLASGTQPKRLQGLTETGNTESRIFYDARPLMGQKNKTFAIIGAGDGAFDYALNLCEHNQVVILNRSKKCRCLPLLRNRAEACGVDIWLEVQVTAVQIVEDKIVLYCLQREQEQTLTVDALLVAVGREPRLDYLSAAMRLGMAKLHDARRLFLAGDVHNGIHRQAAIAAGDGLLAAMNIWEEYERYADSGKKR